jgi:TfoX/Sxy family transcriptional regulator of competence genes
MAWVKVPAEHHPIFRAAVPKGSTTKNMFGGVAAFVNNNMFGGLFGHSIVVKLSDTDRKEALALDGAAPFDPWGNGRIVSSMVHMPESVMDEPAELRSWLRRGYTHVATLPKKKPKPAKKPATKKPATKKPATKKKR